MAVFRLEHTHTITDVYYIEAKSEAEAERMFLTDMIDEPDDTFESDEPDSIEIKTSEPDDASESWYDEEDEY